MIGATARVRATNRARARGGLGEWGALQPRGVRRVGCPAAQQSRMCTCRSSFPARQKSRASSNWIGVRVRVMIGVA